MNNHNQVSPLSKVHVFMGDKSIPEGVIPYIDKEMKAFLEQWKSHGNELTAFHEILYNQFIIITIDEKSNGTSGCSIDAMVHKIKEIGEKLEIDFLSNGKVAFFYENNIKVAKLNEIKKLIEDGIIHPKTKIFNLVNNRLELSNEWIKEADRTWLQRYFINSTAS